MLTCDMAGEQHHVTWHDRVPPVLWSLNTSPSAATGYSPFYLEHGREPRDVTSRAFDTSDVPAASLKWVQIMNQRLEMARKVHSAVDTHAKDAQQRRNELPAQARREPTVRASIGGWFKICAYLDRAVSSTQHRARIATPLPNRPHRDQRYL